MSHTLFFILSKLFHIVLIPGSWLAILMGLGWIAIQRKRYKLARYALISGLIVYGIVSCTPLTNALIRSIETQVSQPVVNWDQIQGIIVLGGAIDTGASTQTTIELGDAAERLTVSLRLLKQYPHLRVLHTGFSGTLSATRASESELARQFWIDYGIEPNRIQIENQSRNTLENAQYTQKQLNQTAKNWVLITSASHMPRSIWTFKQCGLAPVPYPVDVTYQPGIAWGFDFGVGQIQVSKWLHEVVGLWVYRIVATFHIMAP